MTELKPLERVMRYLEMRKAKPMPQLGDSIHSVNIGSEWEAELRLSDLDEAAAALTALQAREAALTEALATVLRAGRLGLDAIDIVRIEKLLTERTGHE